MSSLLERDQRFQTKIEYYLDHKLTKPRPEFANLPICPYVQRYRNSIKIKIAKNSLYEILGWALRNWSDQDIAWVYGFYLDEVPNPMVCEKIIEPFAQQLYQADATVFLDHPLNNNPVAGIWTGFGSGVLLTIQKTSILQKHREQLLKTDYYTNWDDDDLRDLA
jgi:hypothetical protein